MKNQFSSSENVTLANLRDQWKAELTEHHINGDVEKFSRLLDAIEIYEKEIKAPNAILFSHEVALYKEVLREMEEAEAVIQVKKTDLIGVIKEALENNRTGRDWSLCAHTDGALELMHGTYDKSGYVKLSDMDFGDCMEADGFHPGEEGCGEAAKWLAGIVENNAPRSIEIDGENLGLEFIDEQQ